MERIHELVLTPIEGFEQTFMILDSGLDDFIEAHISQCVKIVDKTTGEVYEKVNEKRYAVQETKFCYDLENKKLQSQDIVYWSCTSIQNEVDKFLNLYEAKLVDRKDDVCATLSYTNDEFYHIVILSKMDSDEVE